MIKEITEFVEDLALGPLWVIGKNLFAGHVPVKTQGGSAIPERYLAVLENAGGTKLDDVGGVVTAAPPSAPGDPTYWPEYVEKAVQLLNRAKSYFVAHDDAYEIYNVLRETAGWMLPVVAGGPQYLVCVIDPYGPPAPIENPGESGLFIFSTNYLWKIEEASCGA